MFTVGLVEITTRKRTILFIFLLLLSFDFLLSKWTVALGCCCGYISFVTFQRLKIRRGFAIRVWFLCLCFFAEIYI
uniref:Putative ovule protein n=1 Tax=Solanum chacoense TaxID=4108 RepID=A0A0V0GMK5_SOLCH